MRKIQDYSIASYYFAPHGRDPLLYLGEQIAQRHLAYNDRLIGIIGDAGSGKSVLIKGMFPGLELSNDDDKVNPHKIMQVRDFMEDLPEASTYHMDMRFQLAFTQIYEVVDFVNALLERGRRIVIEHFNLLAPSLDTRADLMVGIGGEIIVTRPTAFGPSATELYDMVHRSLSYRKMSHTAEDITKWLLKTEFGFKKGDFYVSDIHSGFVLRFPDEVGIDLEHLSSRIHEELKKRQRICYNDENHIIIGDIVTECSRPRMHVGNTSEIDDFALVKRLIRDVKTDTYCLVGLINNSNENVENRNSLHYF